MPLAGVVQSGHAVIADIHGVAPAVQQLRQRTGQTLFVLHNEYAHRQPSSLLIVSSYTTKRCVLQRTFLLFPVHFRPVSASVSSCTSDVSSMR